MLRWCSYCQHFIGEIPDYRNLSITHGICTACETTAFDFTESDFKLADSLRSIQHQLQDAGRASDLAAAQRIIENAATENISPVDVLIGIIAPMLYQVGEDWKRGILSVAEEHRFTSYCNAVFDWIASKVAAEMPACAEGAKDPQILLMNAPGNSHTLAIRILTLWLWNKGLRARMIDPPPSTDELGALIQSTRPKLILISIALAEQQFAGVTALAERVSQLPTSIRPRVIVGGICGKARPHIVGTWHRAHG